MYEQSTMSDTAATANLNFITLSSILDLMKREIEETISCPLPAFPLNSGAVLQVVQKGVA